MTTATPTQLRLYQEHKARLARIWTAGITRPVPAPRPPAVAPPPPPLDPNYYCRIKTYPAWFDWYAINTGREPSVRAIAIVVADHFQLLYQQVVSIRRTQPLVWARQLTYYLAHTMTSRSLPEIGRALGGRDHTTVLHGIHRVQWVLERPQTAIQTLELVVELRRKVREYGETHPWIPT